jgi:hypothetical protein
LFRTEVLPLLACLLVLLMMTLLMMTLLLLLLLLLLCAFAWLPNTLRERAMSFERQHGAV